MSRYKHVAAFVGVCLCLGWLSEIAAAQAEVVFTASNTTQTVRVIQNGPGIPNPSLTNQPPAALRGEATSSADSTVGVIGTSAGSFGFGVFGLSSGTPGSTDNPSGVVGFASSTSGKTRGVAGFVFSPDGIAVDAESHGGGLLFAGASGPLGSEVTKFSVDADGNINASGTLSVAGD